MDPVTLLVIAALVAGGIALGWLLGKGRAGAVAEERGKAAEQLRNDLAAVQVGVPKRLLVIDLQEPEEEGGEPVKDPRVFINPELYDHSDQDVPYTEGCLSVPDQYAEVDRPDRIRARWLDENGVQHDEEITGMLAVCLQHEMDHLEGILFIDHLSRLKREMILRKIAKARKQAA